jgi:hypothetical protein
LSDPERNAARAYISVYGPKSPSVATANASRLLANANVAAEIAKFQQSANERVEVTISDWLREVVTIATADPKELVEHWRGACRYCHGDNHQYQRTPQEERDAYVAHVKENGHEAPFDMLGGTGFNKRREPHPDCPECNGLGVSYEIFKDTRHLSPAASKLYAGVKTTKNGMEILMRSQDGALKMLGDHLGAFVKRHEHSGPNGAPIATTGVHANVTLGTTDPIDAAQAYAKIMRGE